MGWHPQSSSRGFKPIKTFLKKLFSFRNAGDMIPMSMVPNIFGAWHRPGLDTRTPWTIPGLWGFVLALETLCKLRTTFLCSRLCLYALGSTSVVAQALLVSGLTSTLVSWPPGPPSKTWGDLVLTPMTEEDAYGFVDPSNVLRGCHLIPAFASGRMHPDSVSISQNARDGADWKYYYVNR